MSNNLQSVQEIIDSQNLRTTPRAFLLLKLCKLSMLFSPESFNDYWEKLQPLRKHLPSDNMKDYKSIKAFVKPQMQLKEKTEKISFVDEIIFKINAAKEKVETNKRDEAIEILKGCEKQLKKIGGDLARDQPG